MSDFYSPFRIPEAPTAPSIADTEICLFRIHGTPRFEAAVLGVSGSESDSPFTRCREDLTRVLTADSRLTLRKSISSSNAHYVLLLSDRNEPILVISSLMKYYGFGVAVLLKTSPAHAVAFLRSMPHLSHLVADSFPKDCEEPLDPAEPLYLSHLFRSLFLFFETPYNAPVEFKDSFLLFRLLRNNLLPISELFGLSNQVLVASSCSPRFPCSLPFDFSLFESAVLLLLSAFAPSILQHRFHTLFTISDGFPVICMHFPLSLYDQENCPQLRFLKSMFEHHGCFFRIYSGNLVFREIQKLPGLQHMIDPYRIVDHVIVSFSPIKRNWSSLMLHSPIFRLPDHFYDNFIW
jgi:hypothetical protein